MKFMLLTALALFSFEVFSQVSIITERIQKNLISQELNEADVARYLDNLNADGSWSDIDYSNRSNTNWEPLSHSRRLLLACRAYNKEGSGFFHSEEAKGKIMKIIEFYIGRQPKSDNWWYNAIGAPVNLGPALVLMKPAGGFGIEQPQLEKFTNDLIKYYDESVIEWPFSNTGANKIWLLNSSINKACVTDNAEVLRENFRLAFEEAEIKTGSAEGIKIDNSFWQHGPQLYCAGYGMSFLADITNFGLLAHDSDYEMTTEQLKTLTNAVLDGYQWFCQNDAFDFSSAGREISRRGAVGSANLKTYISRLLEMEAPRQEELKNFSRFIDGEAPFQSQGNRYFWESDIMVQHGPDYYFSARVPSKRTNATERMNNENLKRKWLPWGATNLMSEGDEYRNLFPVWDWSRIPGVTSFLEDVPGLPVSGGAYLVSPADFAGGVSDGTTGLAAYDYSWDGITGKKAWFFTPEAIYCLGANITTEYDYPVVTSVNQCFSSGPVTVMEGSERYVFEESSVNSGELNWVHHDKFGYLFPAGGNISLRNMDQSGSWSEINLSQSSEKITHKVFSLWYDHGKKPSDTSYEYIIVPSADAARFAKWSKKNPLLLITNTTDIQAVHDKKSGIYGIALYNAGSVAVRKKMFVGANKPCLILFKENKNGITVTLSDPTQTLTDLKLIVSMKLKGEDISINEDGISTVNIDLPAGDEAGKSVTFVFEKM